MRRAGLRTIGRVAKYGAAGAALSVVVAWVCVLRGHYDTGVMSGALARSLEGARAEWLWPAPDLRDQPMLTLEYAITGLKYRRAVGELEPGSPASNAADRQGIIRGTSYPGVAEIEQTEVSAGWPMRALTSRDWQGPAATREPISLARGIAWGDVVGGFQRGPDQTYLPLSPRWAELGVDAGWWGGVLYLLARSARRFRRWRRLRRGLCGGCGYPRAGAAICPECGAPTPGIPPSTPVP